MSLLTRFMPKPEDLAAMVTPEMMAELFKSLGLDPQYIQGEYDRYKGEYEAFKAAQKAAMQHFDRRLYNIEQQNAQIIALLQAIGDKVGPHQLGNCACMDAEKSANGRYQQPG